ncbi:MAG: sigma-70 family RNA polymerase sigma factor [Endomicrobiia bacterium]
MEINFIKNLSDEDLIKQIQVSNNTTKELCFEIIVDRYKEKLFHLIYNYIKYYGTETDAEELLLQVFSNFYFAIKKFQFKSSVYTYLYRIALNLSANFTKSKLKTLKTFIDIDEINTEKEFQEKPDFDYEKQNDAYVIINLAINSLPINQKNALILAYYENKSYYEIAQIMKTTISSVESLLFRAKQNLKKFILKHKDNF